MTLSKEAIKESLSLIGESTLKRAIETAATTGDFTMLGFSEEKIEENSQIARASGTEMHVCSGHFCIRCAPCGDITPTLNPLAPLPVSEEQPILPPYDPNKALQARRKANLSAFTGIKNGTFYRNGEAQGSARVQKDKRRH